MVKSAEDIALSLLKYFTFPLDGCSIHSRQAWMAQDFETGCELKGLPFDEQMVDANFRYKTQVIGRARQVFIKITYIAHSWSRSKFLSANKKLK